MLQYTTISESFSFKLSKVKNTNTNKIYYSIIWYGNSRHNIYSDVYPQICKYLGKYKSLSNGHEWKFKSIEAAKKKYNWILLKWG
jgi:hypothetical protein